MLNRLARAYGKSAQRNSGVVRNVVKPYIRFSGVWPWYPHLATYLRPAPLPKIWSRLIHLAAAADGHRGASKVSADPSRLWADKNRTTASSVERLSHRNAKESVWIVFTPPDVGNNSPRKQSPCSVRIHLVPKISSAFSREWPRKIMSDDSEVNISLACQKSFRVATASQERLTQWFLQMCSGRNSSLRNNPMIFGPFARRDFFFARSACLLDQLRG